MNVPNAKSKADVDPNFEKQLRRLKEDARANGDALAAGGQTRWARPVGFDGDVFDYDGMHTAFTRDKANQDFVAAVANPDSPGVSGDLVTTTTQIDYLACLERAYRMRHAGGMPRLLLHGAGAMKGAGSDQGVYTLCGVEFVRRLVAEAKQGG